MIWNNPEALWLLWILPVIGGLAVFATSRTRRAARLFAGGVMAERLMPALTASGAVLKAALLVAGLGLAIVALARPAWDVYYVKTEARGVDLVVALDVSRSMLADDGGEPRLERARSSVASLVAGLAGDRVGLLLFAGQVLPACPLTLDRGFFLQALKLSSPDAVGRGGTLIGPALDAAEKMLDVGSGRDRLVLLVTDAGDQDSFPETAAQGLKKKGIRVVALGIGRDAGPDAPLVINGQVVRDKKGKAVPARVNGDLLAAIARETGGMYVPAEASHNLPALYARHIEPLQKGAAQEMQEKHFHERYQWFLVPAVVLLMLQAGRPRWPRKRVAGAAGAGAGAEKLGSRARAAAAGAVLAALLAVPGCGGGDESDLVARATAALEKGDAAAAVVALGAAKDERPDEPVLDYDLGCAHQAAGSPTSARESYARSLERGRKPVRARAYVNLAMLDAADLKDLAGEDPAAATPEDRERIRSRAESAIERLQRARDLDPGLAAAAGKQDRLVAWLRNVEDSWAAKDREEARKKRAELKGLAYLEALREEEARIASELGGGTLLQSLALRQRDLREDLAKVPEKAKDGQPPVPEGFADVLAKAVDDAGPVAEAAEKDLAAGKIEAAAKSLLRAILELDALACIWAPPETFLPPLAARQAQAAAAIALAPSAGDAAKTRDVLDAAAGMERDVLRLLDTARQRFEAKAPDPAWNPLATNRARDVLGGTRARIDEALAQLPHAGAEARAPAEAAARELQDLVEDWRLSKLEAAPLARALEEHQRDINRSVAAFDPLAAVQGAPSPAARVAGQRRRLGYLDRALQEAVKPKAPEGQEVPAEAAKQAEEALAALLGLKGAADAGLEGAATLLDAMAWPPEPPLVDALASVRRALRTLWMALVPFDEALKSAAEEEAGLVARNDAADEAAGEKDDVFPEPVRSGAHALPDQAVEQEHTAELVRSLRERLPAETAAAKSQAPEPGAEAKTGPEAEEAAALTEALGRCEGLLAAATESADRAAKTLRPAAVPDRPSLFRKILGEARPDQVRARDSLAEALGELERARLPLGQLAHRIMTLEALVLGPARELAAGREVKSKDQALGAKDLAGAQGKVAPYVDRLPGALARDLAKMAPKPPEGQTEAPEEQQKGFEQAKTMLTTMVGQVQAGHAAASGRLAEGDLAGARDGIDQTLLAARRLWLPFAELKALLEQAISEEAAEIGRSREFGAGADPVPADARQAAITDQERTRELPPRILEKVEAEAQGGAAPPGGPHGAGPGGAAPPPAGAGGLPKEVVELAKKNCPKAEAAMKDAEAKLGAESWSDAAGRQEEAKRLLEEILKALQDQQEKQDQQQPQPQDQPRSQDERERLARAVEERSRKMQEEHQKQRKPTAVEEDW